MSVKLQNAKYTVAASLSTTFQKKNNNNNIGKVWVIGKSLDDTHFFLILPILQ